VTELSAAIFKELRELADRQGQSSARDEEHREWLRAAGNELPKQIDRRSAETSRLLAEVQAGIQRQPWQNLRNNGAIVAASGLGVNLALWLIGRNPPDACDETSGTLYCPPTEHSERVWLHRGQTFATIIMSVGLAAIALGEIGELTLSASVTSPQAMSWTVSGRF
jgi:hypothetical protein